MHDGESPVVGIVLAGGVGSRFGGESPKQLARIAGHSVLHHSLRKFDETTVVDRVVVSANPAWSEEISGVCKRAIYDTPWELVDGGAERNLSVWSAVESLGPGNAKVLVHDAVRPLVTGELIERVARALDSSPAVLPVVPSVDPVVHVQGGSVLGFLPRSSHHRGQTPQGFWLADLRRVMEAVDEDVLASYTTIYELMQDHSPGGYGIATVEGELNNLKITMPVDHMIAGQLLLGE